MKTHLSILTVTLGFALAAVVHPQSSPADPSGQAQPGPEFSGYLSQLFADNPAFSANLEFHSYGVTSGNAVAAQGKLAYLNGMTRFEMDMADASDANLPRQEVSSLTQMGLNTMIAISSPEGEVKYFIYPGLKAYVRRPIPASEAAHYTLEVTAVGDENVQGQNCVKNKVVVTSPEGVAREFTVWNATDLNKFPIKIETVQNGATVILLFRDLKLEAPDAAQFDPPGDYKPYDDFMSLMHSKSGTPAPQ